MNLSLLQLGDSALPIGGYSHSWGLEAAIDCGLVRDPASLEHWARCWLRESLGPLEGVVVAAVCQSVRRDDWRAVVSANELMQASIAPPTLRHASRDMGTQLLALAEAWLWAAEAVRRLHDTASDENLLDNPQSAIRNPQSLDWHHAVVFATLAAAAGATPLEALRVYLHQAALGVISAGVRAIPIGHTHGQQVLARLHDDIATLADSLCERELETAGSFCPSYEALCHAQSQLYTRLFRS
ncbi:urease accessory protein UreF [Planctomycetaceae bacterium SCGC AG-212-F19]|nr:urease accessory protein UreF [Planctomycetaceae bacterium SCGC AG-212-F19]